MSNKNKDLKKDDVNMIRRCFYENHVCTRNMLKTETHISSGGITNILQELQEEGEIQYVSDAASTGGRRSKQYVLNPDYAHIGTVNCRKRVNRYIYDTESYNSEGKLTFQKTKQSAKGSPEDLKQVIQFMLEKDPLIRNVVVSIPGFCEKGVVQVCDFHELEGKSLCDLIPENVITVIENDVNVACIGFHHEQKFQNMALIYQPASEYSGTGLIIHGRLYNGSRHRAGEMRYLYNSRPSEKLNSPGSNLWNEICAIQAVLDPELIGWCSDLIAEEDLRKYENSYPAHLMHIENLDDLIEKGLYAIGKDCLLNRKGENEEGL